MKVSIKLLLFGVIYPAALFLYVFFCGYPSLLTSLMLIVFPLVALI